MQVGRRPGRALLLLLVLAVGVAGPPLVAPATAVAAGKAKKKARKLAKAANREFAEGNFEAGIAKLEKAYALVPKASIVFNVAVAYDQWGGHCTEALSAFDRFFAVCEGCKQEETAKKRLAKLRVRCQAKLSISTVPPGALVKVDGKEAGKAPVELSLAPGKHSLVLEIAGHEPHRQDVLLEEAKQEALAVPLKALAPKPTADKPKPMEAVAADEPKPRKEPEKEPKPEPAAGSPGLPWAWTAVGVGVAGLAAGAVFGVLASGEEQAAEDAKKDGSSTMAQIREHESAGRTNALVADVAFGVGAVALAGGVVLWLLGHDDGADEAGWRPVAVPGGLGMARAF